MSLVGAYDANNIFAKILKGEAKAARVFEDEFALAFLDLFPQSEGHTLVIPKAFEARNLLDAPADGLAALMPRVQRVARGLVNALKPDGVIVTQFNGASAGQTIFHLHFHLIPRFEGRAAPGHGASAMADPAALDALAARISAAMDQAG